MTRTLKHFTGRDSSQRVGQTRLRVLAIIVSATQRGMPLTFRELARVLGVTQNAVVGHVRGLRRDGMVAPSGGSRTLRATCAFTPADQLETTR